MSVIHLLRAELELTTPGGVTAPESLTIGSVLRPDLPIATDGWGNPYVPGTSLAGSLRDHTPEDERETLFGTVEQAEDGAATKVVASTVRVLGTRLELPVVERTVRRRTAVDRHRAAAQENTLHSRELLPAGTKLLVWLRIDTDMVRSAVVDTFIDRLTTWRPYIGGGRTTGYGHARLLRVLHRGIDLGTAEGVSAWLLSGGPDLVDDRATVVYDHAERGGATPAPPLFDHPLRFRVADALHIGSGERLERTNRTGVATVLRGTDGLPLVPGTMWKGVLRARCEFVLRSVGADVCVSVGGAGLCGDCDICVAFGWTEKSGAHDDTPDEERRRSIGARGRLLFTDTPLHGGRIRTRNHVALDRVFGGARDEALFTEETVEDGDLTLTIRTDGEIPETARAALLLALCDLADGRLGVGGGTTRGYGTLAPHPDTAAFLDGQRGRAVAALRAHLDATTTEEVPA
ncbi:RAMP superfamily CRISPR-associated protein [Streptomyces sp. AC558_RSS880]|uniref:RAMP superfamily CRISPR-associated protein n=1 Tax=Streptomyces sp. AC558_RSS880 TaxID=2823687 RepID=UPI001C22EFFB|nr:RAMP superfamily CRISPR-associated protein [Streptomyces sp. AC558_RSS880]